MTESASTISSPETKAALDAFTSQVRGFRGDVEKRLGDCERRVERIALEAKRTPRSSETTHATPEFTKAFAAYLRRGDEQPMRSLDLKGLSTAVDADGGYLVAPEVFTTIRQTLRDESPVRALANVVTTNAGVLEVLIDQTEAAAAWADETTARGETGSPTIEKVSIAVHELTASPKATQKLLDDSAFDVEAWLAQQVSDKFRRAENAAFINGDGVDKPRGVLDYTKTADASRSAGEIGYLASVVDGAFAASDPGDRLIDLVYALNAGHRQGAVWLMNSKTAGAVRKFKDADGRYLWAEGLGDGGRATLLGHPVLVAEDMPDIASDSFPIAFGDFRAGYTVADRADVRTLRDPFSAKPHVLFYTTKRVGGAVVDFTAIKLLKMAVS